MKNHNNELEIDEDLKLERNTWTAQRIAWVVICLILLAALLGFTGRGGVEGINKQKVSTTSRHMEVEYDRYLRDEVSAEMKVHLRQISSAAPSISFSKAFYEKIRVEQVVPEPEAVQVGSAGITYTFRAGQPESSIMFYLKPMHIGPLTITAGSPDGETVTLSQFVYP
ncbi:MAG TPA: hypothetical protein VIG72_12940 [Pontibacter sp.]